MKHIFVINSYTTFLTAVGTVNYLKMDPLGVSFIYVRNFKNSVLKLPWQCYDLSGTWDNFPARQVWRNMKLRINLFKAIDDFVESTIQSEYKLYCPHYAHPFFQCFYTNEHCVDGSYIQEGGIPFRNAYRNNPNCLESIFYGIINKLYLRTNRMWLPHKWYYKGVLFKQPKIDSYAISDSFFRYLPSENHIVSWPQIKADMHFEKESTFFIFDGFVYHHLIESDFYIKCCKELINENSSLVNYVRFHPSQSEREREIITDYFVSLNKKIIIMNQSIPFESIIASNQKLKIVGLGSSLLFFARDFGHTVVCHDRWLIKSRLYRRYKKSCGFMFFDEFGL